MAKLPIQVNLMNMDYQSTSNEDIPGVICQLNDGNYNGTVTCYLEVIAKVGSAESVDVELHNPGDTVKASVTVTATAMTRYRSTSFSLDSGATEYNLASNNISGETLDLHAARIIIIQENASGDITETEVQIEVAINDGEIWSTSPYSIATRIRYKYFRYDASRWDPPPHSDANCAIYLEVVYAVTDSMYDVNFYLYEGDPYYDQWSSPVTILTGGTSETPVRVRSSDLSADIDAGNVYTLGYATEDDKAGRGVTVYSAKLIFYLYDTGGIDKLQTQVQMISCQQGEDTGDSERKYFQYWDPGEIDGYGFRAFHQIFADTDSDPPCFLIETSGSSEIAGSTSFSDTDSGEERPFSWLIKRTGSKPPTNLDFTATIIRYAQGIRGEGGDLFRAWVWLRREGTLSGNITAKIYASTGTPEVDAVPTGSALVTSDTVAASSVGTGSSPTWGSWVPFDFSTLYTLEDGTYYFLSIEYSGSDGSDYLEIPSYDWTTGFNSASYVSSWTFSSDSLSVEKYEDLDLSDSAEELDVDMTAVWTMALWGSEITFYFDVALLEEADLSITESDAVETTTVTDVVTDVLIPGPTLLIDETDAVESVGVTDVLPRPDVVYDAAEMITTPSYDTEPGAANYRVVVPAADIDFEGEQIRVLLLGDDSVTLNITSCSMGLREGSSDDYEVAAFQKLTFGGEDGVAIPAGSEVYSDWEDFPCDEAEDYLVHIYVAAAHEYPWEAD